MFETTQVSPALRLGRLRPQKRLTPFSLLPRFLVGQGEGSLAKKAAISVFFGTFAFVIAATCFGAPIKGFLDTINLGFFFSTLVLMPGACLLTDDLSQWKRTYLSLKPQNTAERVYSRLFAATVVGAWVGAWAAPLDWNCTWQRWPIPCFLGSVGGNLCGSLGLVMWLSKAQSKADEKQKRRLQWQRKRKLVVW